MMSSSDNAIGPEGRSQLTSFPFFCGNIMALGKFTAASVGILLVFSVVVPGHVITPDLSDADKEQCKISLGTIMQGQFQNIIKCSKQYEKKKDNTHRSSCILRCVMIIVGFLDINGQIVWEQRDYFLHYYFPENIIQHVNTTVAPCWQIAQNSTFLPIKQDYACDSYTPFLKCALKKITNICE